MPDFSTRLQELMHQRGVKLADVSAAVGKSTQTVHKWTKGGDIGHESLLKLAAYLNTNWLELRYGPHEVAAVVEYYYSKTSSALENTLLYSIIANERRLNEIVTAMKVGIWELDFLHNRLYWNSNCWELMTGESHKAGWIENKTGYSKELMCSQDIPMTEAAMRYADSARNNEVIITHFRVKWRPDVWLFNRAIVSKDANGRLIRLSGTRVEKGYEADSFSQEKAPIGRLTE